ncbi:MAG: ATP-binding protein, partial [Elusimicrobiota bacterium]
VIWLRDLKRAFALVEEALGRLGRGEIPDDRVFSRKDEMGRVLAAIAHVAKTSRSMQSAMMHWDRLAVMGQLAGGVAHEINNPLVGVLGQADLLRSRLNANHPARLHVDKIVEAAQRCRKIVRNLLDFARPREAEFAEASLAGIIDSVLDMTGSDFEKAGIRVERSLAEDLPALVCRSADLAEVFLNLFVNARDAMPHGGILYIRAFEEQAHLRVEIEDTGAGILPEDLGHLFETFFTTKEFGKGTGLGLAVSFGIVHNHGGRIKAESEGLGKGAKFTIVLPIKRD